LEVHRKAGNLKGVPAEPKLKVLPEPWPEDSIEKFVQFITTSPPTVCLSDIAIRVKGDASKMATVPHEWKGYCPL
jgi:hypothetical protein